MEYSERTVNLFFRAPSRIYLYPEAPHKRKTLLAVGEFSFPNNLTVPIAYLNPHAILPPPCPWKFNLGSHLLGSWPLSYISSVWSQYPDSWKLLPNAVFLSSPQLVHISLAKKTVTISDYNKLLFTILSDLSILTRFNREKGAHEEVSPVLIYKGPLLF